MAAESDLHHGFLYLDRFTCVQEKEGLLGRDSPYFLVFVGHAGPGDGCDVIRVRHPDWEGAIATGDTRVTDVWVHHAVHGTSTVLVALLEQDWQCDIDDAVLDGLRREMSAHWRHCRETASRPDDRADKAAVLFERSLRRVMRNDHLIGLAPLPITTDHGALPVLTLGGEDARYRTVFRVRALVP
ncbi:hypothetical protein [Uliginosibacterium sp. H1]|uniref:hypothetical protein n=1 Tax=Uliginosibacterium sp. H1 TaxID=3114757 RepID=UPI002E17C51B|nr:hypothetical protein [Uliginosibacterium sp. H1]